MRLMYIATVLLNRTEKEFWKMTLRKLVALYEEYKVANGIEDNKETPNAYIDQVM